MPNIKRTLTYKGKTQTIPAWAKELDIADNTIRSRLDVLGWTVEEALTTPAKTAFRPGACEVRLVRPVPALKKDERGRGVARWSAGGKDNKRVFGPWGDPRTVAEYTRWAAEWYANQGNPTKPAEAVSVAGLISRCLDWAEATYQKAGRITSEVHGFRAALRAVADLYGDTEAAAFGPNQLRAVQGGWVADGKAIKTCNDYLRLVIRCWRFGVGRGLIQPAIADALAHVEPLVPGRTQAPRSEKVKAAPDEHIEAILPHLHADPARQRVLEAIVRVQRLTGMRPGEAVSVCAEEIDSTREPWLYTPASKTMHLEKDRRVWIGPKARELLLPWLESAEPRKPLFRIEKYRGVGLVAVSVNYLRDCIANACLTINLPIFKPNQIRHSKANEVQLAYEDDEATAAILGNTPEVARQVYTDSPADAVARRIAEALG